MLENNIVKELEDLQKKYSREINLAKSFLQKDNKNLDKAFYFVHNNSKKYYMQCGAFVFYDLSTLNHEFLRYFLDQPQEDVEKYLENFRKILEDDEDSEIVICDDSGWIFTVMPMESFLNVVGL